MIKIDNKINCSGCYACYNICPKNCITMEEDEEGFRYPKVDLENCINCHLCEKICPILNKYKKDSKGYLVYGAVNKNKKVLKRSTSGGVFFELGKLIIEKYNGIVFGVRYDHSKNAVFDYATDLEKLKKFSGSKYVQAKVNDSYKKVKNFLDDDYYVLFSGTPCQIAGLKSYLKKDYVKLYTCDLVCEGVQSDLLLNIYKKHYENKYNSKIIDIKFRNKKFGWKYSGFLMTFKNKKKKYIPRIEISYMYFLYSFSFMRPSCYECKFRELNSGSDFKLADFWEVEQSKNTKYNYYGVSHLLINNKKASDLFDNIRNNFLLYSSSVAEVKKLNQSFNTFKYNNDKKVIFKEKIANKNAEEIYNIMESYLNLNFLKKVKFRIKLYLVRFKYTVIKKILH